MIYFIYIIHIHLLHGNIRTHKISHIRPKKISHIRPKLKKTDLDKELFTNYRPIANIAFMSKVIEKTVALQVQAYLNDNQLLPSFQSAYRQYHSTETALLKVTNDILMTIDSRRDAILILLDLSAAFDTLDHNILIKRLNSYFGFSGSVLQWFSSYIKDRGQSVVIGDVISSPQKLDYGIPQGSIVGPLLLHFTRLLFNKSSYVITWNACFTQTTLSSTSLLTLKIHHQPTRHYVTAFMMSLLGIQTTY